MYGFVNSGFQLCHHHSDLFQLLCEQINYFFSPNPNTNNSPNFKGKINYKNVVSCQSSDLHT